MELEDMKLAEDAEHQESSENRPETTKKRHGKSKKNFVHSGLQEKTLIH
jgi:hypothetical protein